MDKHSKVVSGQICSGCGMCSAVCPAECIKMETNYFGEYRPTIDDKKCRECSLCLRACPFVDSNPNEIDISKVLFANQNEIKFDARCGYYLKGYVGYSENHRLTSASGGLATWFLEKILTEKEVEAVVCVGQGPDYDRLLEFKIIHNADDLRKCSRSSYYAVEMSQVIRDIKRLNKKVAVIGLPCFIKAIRLSCSFDKRLAGSIKYTAGLVCGHLPSKAMVDYVAHCFDKDYKKIKNISFRVKDAEGKKGNNNINMNYEDGHTIISDFDGYLGQAFLNKLFMQEGCKFCDDTFAECADIVFMDAWLPEFIPESEIKGTSLALVRNKNLVSMFEASGSNNIKEISVDRIIFSQERVGVVPYKREAISMRILLSKMLGRTAPKKRCSKLTLKKYIKLFLHESMDMYIRHFLKSKWKKGINSFEEFNKLTKRIGLLIKVRNTISNPLSSIRNGLLRRK